jgi:hypothetical protein
MIPKGEQGFICQLCQCCRIEALIQGNHVVTADVKGDVTSYMAHCLINLSGLGRFVAFLAASFIHP